MNRDIDTLTLEEQILLRTGIPRKELIEKLMEKMKRLNNKGRNNYTDGMFDAYGEITNMIIEW